VWIHSALGHTDAMATKRSAGILLFRRIPSTAVLIGHPGGPYYRNRDEGVWSIPKGEYGPDEPAVVAARREFTEELGLPVPNVRLHGLGSVIQRGGKEVTIWAAEADLDVSDAVYGTFEMIWPPGSGRLREFEELDRAEWTDLALAERRLLPAQLPFLERLRTLLDGAAG